jgi:hypothetical protein
VAECGYSLPQWQAQGYDAGTSVAPFAPTTSDDIIAMARAKLWV